MADLVYISFGAGVQSTALLVCSNLGLHGVPKADVAFFADTTMEPPWVYENVERMKAWSKIPVEVVKAKEKELYFRRIVAGAPLWTTGRDGRVAPLQRSCTHNLKITPITQAARRHVGTGRKSATALIGISYDEFHRMKPSRVKWITNEYPLVDARLTRQDCKAILTREGLPIPHRSACVFCPYHSDDYWRALKEHYPDQWDRACQIDDSIAAGASGVKGESFLHRSLVRLQNVKLDSDQGEFGWANECGGICGL